MLALVGDGTGKYIDVCNFCGREDIILPTSTVWLCPDCLGKGDWRVKALPPRQAARMLNYPLKVANVGLVEGYKSPFRRGRFMTVFSGICSICGKFFYGSGAVVEGYACFRCMWTKLGKKSYALRVDGVRVV